MHKKSFEMINIGLISYILFLIPTQELYRTMGTFILNALSNKPCHVAAYFKYIFLSLPIQKLYKETSEFCFLHYMPGHIT